MIKTCFPRTKIKCDCFILTVLFLHVDILDLTDKPEAN